MTNDYDEWKDEFINLIYLSMDQRRKGESPADFVRRMMRLYVITEMEPAQRRRCCADMEANFPHPDRKTTGRFFNGFASASAPRDPGGELGERIMEKRNPNYQPDNHNKGGSSW